MGNIISIVGFLLIMAIASGLIGLSYLIYNPIKKRLLKRNRLSSLNAKRIDRLYLIIVLLIGFYMAWTAFFPNNGFYKEIFERNTEIEFPQSGKIIKMDSHFPDHFGDYWAAAIVDLSESDFNEIVESIESNENYEADTSVYKIGIGIDFEKLTENLEMKDFEMVFVHTEKQWFKIAFGKNRKKIIFERSSS